MTKYAAIQLNFTLERNALEDWSTQYDFDLKENILAEYQPLYVIINNI